MNYILGEKFSFDIIERKDWPWPLPVQREKT